MLYIMNNSEREGERDLSSLKMCKSMLARTLKSHGAMEFSEI